MSVLGLETIKKNVLEGSSPGPFPRNFPKVALHAPIAQRAGRRDPPGQRRGPSEWPWGGSLEAGAVGGDGILEGDGRKRGLERKRLERKCLRMLMMVVVRMVRMDAG